MMGEWLSRLSPTTARSSTRSAAMAPSTTHVLRCRGSSLSGDAGSGKSPDSRRCGLASPAAIDYMLIENLDYEVSDEDSLALTDVIEAHILGRDLTFDDAVQARRRQRLRLAPPPENGNGARDS